MIRQQHFDKEKLNKYIKSKCGHCILLDTVIAHTNVLDSNMLETVIAIPTVFWDICLVLLFQVLHVYI